jgi:major outer membrane protein
MKKSVLTVLVMLASGAAYALPVGNPADASLLCDGLFLEGHCGDPCDPCLTWLDAFSVRIGFYGDYVFNRHMEVDDNARDCDVEHTKIITNAGFLAVNFWDRFDIFATLGATNIFVETNERAFGLPDSGRFEIKTDTHFSWSLGVRGTIWECGCTTLGAEAQYFYTRPDITRLTLEDSFSVYPNGLRAKYREWQIGVGIAHRINMLVPYAAVKIGHSQFRLDEIPVVLPNEDLAILYDLESKKFWGYAIGVSFVDCEKASLTVEGRWANEKALYVNGQIRF